LIRPTEPEDQSAIIQVATASGLFEPSQTAELVQLLEQFYASEDSREIWLTDDDDGPVGVAYLAPERMTEGTWNLYLIAIHPARQRQGRGEALLEHIQNLLIQRGERILLVETSGTEDFDYVRAFYRKSGFSEEARIREFYAAGVDKVVYRKALEGSR
jgi:ribosomal protein S18 acetylase RimI-like enzyme